MRQKASTDSDIVTLVSEDEQLKVKNQNDEWAKVKVDGKTGYVSKDYAKVTYKFGKAKSMKQIRAEEQRKREEQAAKEAAARAAQSASESEQSSGTSQSSSSGSSSQGGSSSAGSSAVSSAKGSATGSRIASYAQQFVGNPYRYGGNSLTNGIDCSGFTQQIYAKFGYSISRTSSSQAGNGVSVSTSNLQPGDLVFYGNGGGINHVALYIGGGQVVHASNSAPYPKGGIKISSVNYRTPVCARRIL